MDPVASRNSYLATDLARDIGTDTSTADQRIAGGGVGLGQRPGGDPYPFTIQRAPPGRVAAALASGMPAVALRASTRTWLRRTTRA